MQLCMEAAGNTQYSSCFTIPMVGIMTTYPHLKLSLLAMRYPEDVRNAGMEPQISTDSASGFR